MKHFKSLVFLAIFALMAFFPINSVKAADTLDRSCDTSSSFSTTKIGSGTWQTFTPSQNRLSKITVHVFRHQLDVPAPNVTLKVYTNAFHVGLLFNAGSKTIADAGPATLTYDFTDKEVTPGDSYRIALTTDGDVSWFTKTGTCYRAGDAYTDSKIIDPRVDYGFATYGYTVEDNPPVSALDLDEDEDAPATTDEQNQSNDTPVSSDTTTPSVSQVSTNMASPNQQGPASGIVEQTKSLVNQIPFVSNEDGNNNSYIWFVIGGAGLAIIIAIGLFIYLRIKKKKQSTNYPNQNI